MTTLEIPGLFAFVLILNTPLLATIQACGLLST